jgi:heterodisulfide reductase subunit A-like polyferredoxin
MSDTKQDAKGGGKIGSVLVVGAGIGGMQASLDLANAGYHVTLVEETPAIGGRMAQLDKTFPTNDCSMCTISPKLIEVGKNLNINLLTNSDVGAVTGAAGNFSVEVRVRPRYIDLAKCNSCGDCMERCPVETPSEFDGGMANRKAVYKRYPQAIPGAPAVSKADRAPCVLTCPASVNCQGYAALIAKGLFAEAYDLIRQNNPFVSICGRICHHPCEGKCNRKDLDQPVAINNLKRFVSDWVRNRRSGGEAAAPAQTGKADRSKQRVAVVGGGPAGLTAARDLALKGYPVTLFDASEKLGGTMRAAIPAYRLPDEALDQDIGDITASGFEVQTGRALGRDFTLSDLAKNGYKAAFLALGCTKAAPITKSTDGTPIKGLDLRGVLYGLDFLHAVKAGKGPKLHGKAVVIGGGNVAIDVAMTARRQGAEHVELISLERREEMPAHEWEIADAVAEGITINPSWGPMEFLGKDGKVTGLKLQECTCVFDSNKKFNPQFNVCNYCEVEADFIILAIGQRSDFSFLAQDDPLWDKNRRFIAADPVTLQTNLQWVFAGGDMVTGPKSVVEAVNHGHEAAESIDRFLTGRNLAEGRLRDKSNPAKKPDRAFAGAPRAVPEKIAVKDRQGWREIEQALTEEAAVAEAKRCMQCGICCECMQCVAACTAKAVDHGMKERVEKVDVGAIVLATGFEPFDAKRKPEYGYGRYRNVVTSLEFERVLSASGPFQGHVVRPSDHKPPKRVAWIQCVGSRDRSLGNDYCSGVCCMYAIKEAIMAVDHVPGLEATVFYNDIRAYGKGFETYYDNARKKYGVKFRRGLVSTVKERPKTKNLALQFVDEGGGQVEEEFDLIVLSIGLRPSASSWRAAAALGVELDEFGFCKTDAFAPGATNRPGVYVLGAFASPVDIPETVMSASTAAAHAGAGLKEARGTRIRERTYPPERDVSGEAPRTGVFICRCGTNIARTVGVPDVVAYAKTLPGVAHAEENLYTCSTDTQRKLVQVIAEHRLNRVVVASCTPRTHEPLFQDTLREAGLNRRLFEMANIRDQCSWVHANAPALATRKARDLVRMAVARAAVLEPVQDLKVKVDQSAIVIGGGVAGMTASLSLAGQGFPVTLVEKEAELGGIARKLTVQSEGRDPAAFAAGLARKVASEPLIKTFTGAEITDFSGHMGGYALAFTAGGEKREAHGGAVVVATGGAVYKPEEYGYGTVKSIVTQIELEERLSDPAFAKAIREVVMIQCVGSRDEKHPSCSRICCHEAVKNALGLKQANPSIQVYVFYRDIRTYGMDELNYSKAREAGVVFLRFEPERAPEVSAGEYGLRVSVVDTALNRPVELRPDLLVLSAGVVPHPTTADVSRALKVPLTGEGFFLEAHMKLRPLDFATDGIFLAGLAHAPKLIGETVSQAMGAAARAATIISKPVLERSGEVSVVDQKRCAACLTCVRLCPYNVPTINEAGVAYIEAAACQGCGVCASACPRKAISTLHYSDGQLVAKTDAMCIDDDESPALAACGE